MSFQLEPTNVLVNNYISAKSKVVHNQEDTSKNELIDDLKCPVCFEPFDENPDGEHCTVVLEPCQHLICHKCSELLKIEGYHNCPICRKAITSMNIWPVVGMYNWDKNYFADEILDNLIKKRDFTGASLAYDNIMFYRLFFMNFRDGIHILDADMEQYISDNKTVQTELTKKYTDLSNKIMYELHYNRLLDNYYIASETQLAILKKTHQDIITRKHDSENAMLLFTKDIRYLNEYLEHLQNISNRLFPYGLKDHVSELSQEYNIYVGVIEWVSLDKNKIDEIVQLLSEVYTNKDKFSRSGQTLFSKLFSNTATISNRRKRQRP